MSSDGQNGIVYKKLDGKHDKDIESWNRRWSLVLSFCHGYAGVVGFLDVSLVCHEAVCNYVLQLGFALNLGEEEKRLMALDSC